MGFGVGRESVSVGSGLPLGLLAICLAVGLALGFVASNAMAIQGTGQDKVSLSESDKNFLVNMANSQVDLTTRLTALQSAQLDWCTAQGGFWFTNQRQAQLQVTAEQAQNLQKAGAQVQQMDGNFLATVAILDRGSCIVPLGKTG